MLKSNNKHIYVGLGTLTVLLLGAFIVYKKNKHKKKQVQIIGQRSIDFSVFDSPDLSGSGNCMDR